MLANTTVTVRRHIPGPLDAEGRPTAGTLLIAMQALGHLFAQVQSSVLSDGRLVTITQYKALLPDGSDIRVGDLIDSEVMPGEYRVTSVTPRIGPDGRVHHLSVTAEVGA